MSSSPSPSPPQSSECPICAETLSLSVFAGARRTVSRPCCGNVVCQSCLYQHIQSVMEEGITNQGRSQILCPLGCGKEIDDSCIRLCIRQQHPQHFLQTLWGSWIVFILSISGWFHNQDPMRSSRYYTIWLHFLHSPAERQALRRYEQWNLAVALRQTGQETMTCPAPDCSCTWIVASPEYRQRKWAHERQRTFLWYRPPKPEPSDNLFVLPEYVNLLLQPPEEEYKDGRRAVCPKCHTLFCGLCRSPWNITRRKGHAGITCKTHARNLGGDADYSFVGQQQNARTCPGCSLRTSRVDGCNHMTCPCGMEWCYVCERKWNRSHYTCVDRPTRSTYEMCVVS